MKQGKVGFNPGSLLLVVIFAACLLWVMGDSMPDEEPGYSQVRQLFQQEKVEEFTITSDAVLIMKLRDAAEGSETLSYQLYDFQLFYDDFNDLVQEQAAKGIIKAYDYPEPEKTNWIEMLLPYVLILGAGMVFWMFISNRQVGGGGDRMSKFGSANVRTLSDKDMTVTKTKEMEQLLDFGKAHSDLISIKE